MLRYQGQKLHVNPQKAATVLEFRGLVSAATLAVCYCQQTELGSNLPLPVLPKGLWSAITAPRPNMHQL